MEHQIEKIMEEMDEHEANCKECKTIGYCIKYYKIWEKLRKLEEEQLK